MKKIAIFAVSVLFVSGCSFSRDALFPSLTGSDAQEEIAFSQESSNSIDMPVLGSASFEPIQVSKGGNTGTFVGKKVVTFRNELTQLQNSIKSHNAELQRIRANVINNAQQYHKTVATIESRLQIGTTPGNPQMFAMLQSAQNNVQFMSASSIALNQLSNRVSADATTTSYLLDSIRSTYSVSGAVDEDHRQLRILENETNQTSIIINSLLSEVTNDASRQQQYIETANGSILGLDAAIRQGNHNGVNTFALSGAPVYSAPAAMRPAPRPMGMSTAPMTAPQGKPLFAAKFNKADVKYLEGLRSAVSNATSKKPNVMFDVVAVSPQGANQSAQNTARTKASAIFSDIVGMGVSADRVSLSARTSGEASSPEVQVFVR